MLGSFFYFGYDPSQVGILCVLRSLDDSLAFSGPRGTSQPRGLGSGVAFRGIKKRSGGDSPQSGDEWDLRDQNCTFSRGGRAGLKEVRSPSLLEIFEKAFVHALTCGH